ncbi:MAG: hypothetical protein DRP01_09445 [Archaeoglobales archaeon]|nr:MAG: hypothetical protein DRP01_09445 [Archaeoglobales archaeon]
MSEKKNWWGFAGPVVGVRVYRNDVRVVRSGRPFAGDVEKVSPIRGMVHELTWKSRRRLMFTALNSNVDFGLMITLTYPRVFPQSGKEVKANLRDFLRHMRKRAFYGQFEYLWFLEFQKRGAPHIHILCDLSLPCDVRERREMYACVSMLWAASVATTNVDHLKAGTRTERLRSQDGGRRYVAKYASKTEQKKVPVNFQDVGRWWGCSRGVPPIEPPLVHCSEVELRHWLKVGGWEYLPDKHTPMYSVLYNAAKHLPSDQEYDIIEL